MSVIHHLFDPVVGVLFLLLAALIASGSRREALSRGLVLAAAFALAALYLLPVSTWLAKPLEDAYPRPAQVPVHVDGILVLDGGIRPGIVRTRDTLTLSAGTLRMATGAELARRYPDAKLIYSGTSSDDPRGQAAEAALAEKMFVMLGVAPGRVRFEHRSRDTWQNLNFSRQMVQPKPGETWLLVTSAIHMRRSMGIARRIGWTMVPWPSDYETATRDTAQPRIFAAAELVTLDAALHEWLGLITYSLQDRLR